jgi:hypothetical protein
MMKQIFKKKNLLKRNPSWRFKNLPSSRKFQNSRKLKNRRKKKEEKERKKAKEWEEKKLI